MMKRLSHDRLLSVFDFLDGMELAASRRVQHDWRQHRDMIGEQRALATPLLVIEGITCTYHELTHLQSRKLTAEMKEGVTVTFDICRQAPWRNWGEEYYDMPLLQIGAATRKSYEEPAICAHIFFDDGVLVVHVGLRKLSRDPVAAVQVPFISGDTSVLCPGFEDVIGWISVAVTLVAPPSKAASGKREGDLGVSVWAA